MFKIRNGMDLARAVKVLVKPGLGESGHKIISDVLANAGFSSGRVTVSKLELERLQELVSVRECDKTYLPAVIGRVGDPKKVLSTKERGKTNVSLLRYYQIENHLRSQSLSSSTLRIEELSPAQICSISPYQIRSLSTRQIKSLSPAQILMFKSAQIRALYARQIKSLLPVQIRALSPRHIRALYANQIWALSTDQIRSLSPDQVRALLANQVKSLLPAQIQALSPDQILRLKIDNLSLMFSLPSLTDEERALFLAKMSPSQIKELDTKLRQKVR